MKEYYGVIKEIKTFKWGGFFYLEMFRLGTIQCVLKNTDLIDSLVSESYVKITGEEVNANVKKQLVESEYEVAVSEIEVLTEPVEKHPINIYEKTLKAESNNILDNRAVTLRNKELQCVFKIQNEILNKFRTTLSSRGFTSISTPKIVAGVAEGGANMFQLDYFGKDAFLTQSPQLYKQMMCGVFGQVYETAPVFRAEEHATSRHINEYTSLDVECVLKNSFTELIELEASIIKDICKHLVLNHSEKLEYLGIEPILIDNLNNYEVYTVQQVKEILGSVGNNPNLTGQEEIEIGAYAKEKFGTDFVYITHYSKEKRPFYTMVSENGETTESFDLLFKGMEITSGGQRKHNYNDYIQAMEELNMNPKNFESYLQTFKYGMPYHGGFAIGLERLTAKICGIDSVKMATLFPRDVERLTP